MFDGLLVGETLCIGNASGCCRWSQGYAALHAVKEASLCCTTGPLLAQKDPVRAVDLVKQDCRVDTL